MVHNLPLELSTHSEISLFLKNSLQSPQGLSMKIILREFNSINNFIHLISTLSFIYNYL